VETLIISNHECIIYWHHTLTINHTVTELNTIPQDIVISEIITCSLLAKFTRDTYAPAIRHPYDQHMVH